MLDLTVLNNRSYDIKLLDGTELHIKRPSQSMVQFLLTLKDLSKSNDEKSLLTAFSNLFVRIVNRNTDGKKYDHEQLAEDYDFQTISYVIQDYFNYWDEEVDENVDFPQSQLGEA